MTTKNKNELDMNKLTKALDNVNNDNIMNLTTRKLMELNLKILKELMLDNETLISYLRKLKGYKYVDEIGDLKQGAFIKWIRITDPNNLVLNQCGLVCDIKITDDDVIIICKNFMHRHYTFKMDQEMVIISALDHLDAEEQLKKKTRQEVKANTRANKNYSNRGAIEEDDDISSEEESDTSLEEDDD
jgi:hypothetical protein